MIIRQYTERASSAGAIYVLLMSSATKVSEYCNMETFRARCQHGDVIVMETALFGRMRVGRCITSDAYLTALQQLDPNSLGCSADVLGYVDRVCSGRSTCDFSVPNPELYAFRPCSGQLTMYIEASYSCVAGMYLFSQHQAFIQYFICWGCK